MKVTRHTLKNGIRTVIVEMPDREVIATTVYVGAGGRYETPETYGISHFVEHMLFNGTRKYPTEKIFCEEIEKIGGHRIGSTASEYTVYGNVVPSKYTFKSFDVLSEQVSRPLLKKEDFDKERGIITEEVNHTYGNPSRAIMFRLRSFLWEEQPVGSDLLGPKENIKTFNRESILSYTKDLYVSENMVICISGNVKAKEVLKELENAFSTVLKGPQVIPQKIDASQDDSRAMIFEEDAEQAQVGLAYKSFSFSDKRKNALDILMCILGKGGSSILYEEIRAKRGLAYSIRSNNDFYTDAGACRVIAGLNKEKVPEAVSIIKKELYASKDKLFSKDQIKRAKEYLKGNHVSYLDDTLNVCSEYGWKELLDPEKLEPEEIAKRIDKVTAEEIREVANDVFQDKNENLVVIGPYKDKKKFEDALKNY